MKLREKDVYISNEFEHRPSSWICLPSDTHTDPLFLMTHKYF